ncbi:hypothetical protein KW800_00030 [Candidatus Parcubacteria bacterium]|nr:hypothetical protein [Candidatus Parcubacteria bacterium]
MKEKLTNPLILAGIIVAGLIVVKLATGWPGSNTESINPDAEMAKVIAEISNFMILPDESPVMITIQDTRALQGQPFFKNALRGDDIIVFQQASKAILWRPSTHKIVEASIINISPAPVSTSTP